MTEAGPSDPEITIRRATATEDTEVLGVLDAANVETDAGAIRSAIERDAVLVAESPSPDRSTLLGALVLDGTEITHVAVRRRRRGQGIGTALVRAAAKESDALRAEFDAGVKPFYAALGFDVEPGEEPERFVGVRRSNEE